ncbi:UDP-glucosyltransferase 2-like [Epargyreus clarus]|uniref:UDP-glucosyltransferase 2-like n=1 Tax=Epargyreus clarus TaxID=520877 RepID=UPI003C2FC585
MPNIAELSRNPYPMHHMLHMGPMFAQKTLEHPEMQELLHDSEVTFDLVLVEWFFSGLLAPLAEVYNCPLIWYRSGEMCWQSLRMMHEASSPTYSTDLHVTETPTPPFSAKDRLYQSWLQLYMTSYMYLIRNRVEIPAYEALYREPMRIRGKFLADFDYLVYNASLMFSNSHPLLSQKLPLPLNVKYVGGHHLEPTTPPLPQDLKKIMDVSKNGVIFFSMGSVLKGEDLPDHMRRSLIQYFAQLKQTIIWKFESQIDNLPKNVHVVEWAPQQSILNHPNTILFITHGGMLSILEATHFGVPLIGIPIFADQFSNVDFAVARGNAIRVDFSEEFPRKLKDAIDNVLESDSYLKNAKANSFIFRHRLASPQTELNHWIQLVIQTKGAVHLRSPALQISTLDRLYLDAAFLFILMLWFLTKGGIIVRTTVLGERLKPNTEQSALRSAFHAGHTPSTS